MREALLLTEGNLSSLIGVRYKTGLTDDSNVDARILYQWRHQVRRALGYFATEPPPSNKALPSLALEMRQARDADVEKFYDIWLPDNIDRVMALAEQVPA